MKKLLSTLVLGLSATAFAATAMAAPTQTEKHPTAPKHHVVKKEGPKTSTHHKKHAAKPHTAKHEAKKPVAEKPAPKKA